MVRSPSSFLPSPEAAKLARQLAIAPLAYFTEDSMIRQVAQEVWDLTSKGAKVCNLSIGDFRPHTFPTPPLFVEKVVEEIRAGQTNYTPSDGLPELRKAIADMYARDLGIDFGPDSVLVTSGARPAMYVVFQSVLQPGDGFAYGIPSWNTQYYAYLNQSKDLGIRTTAASRFLPTAAQVASVAPSARILLLNSPLNPTGTAYRADELEPLCRVVLAENQRRERAGERPLILVYDQCYRTLMGPGLEHVHPLGLVPEIAPWTVYIDAISKSLCSTGLRVGWAVVPPYMKDPMKSLVGHLGSFAPRPEQRAAAWFLAQPKLLQDHSASMRDGIQVRLDRLLRAVESMKAAGLPVAYIPPEGAIYLSIQFKLQGRRTPEGRPLDTNEAIRIYLLHHAGLALVPFQGFGLDEESGWFRISVGAVGIEELDDAMLRLEASLRRIQ